MQILESNLKIENPTKRRNKTKYIVLNHSKASRTSVDDIKQWYENIDYHFLVRKNGEVYRLLSSTLTSDIDNESIMVCIEGHFHIEYMTEAQRSAISNLIKYLKSIYKKVEVKRHLETETKSRHFPWEAIRDDYSINDVDVYSLDDKTPLFRIAKNEDEFIQKRLASPYCPYRSIEHFQLNHDLKVDGIVGQRTRTLLNNYVVRTADIFPLNESDSFGTVNHNGYYDTYDRPAIKMIQEYLWLPTTGLYSDEVINKVKEFQKNNDLEITGNVDINTWNEMVGDHIA